METGIKFYGNRESSVQVRDLAKALDYVVGNKVSIGYDEVSILYKAEEDLVMMEKEIEAQVDRIIELEDSEKELKKKLLRKYRQIEELKEENKRLKNANI